MKALLALSLLFAALLVPLAAAHTGEAVTSDAVQAQMWAVLQAAAAAVALATVAALLLDRVPLRLRKPARPALFAIFLVAGLGTTLYLAGTTVWLNTGSPTGGPVHWHADFEVWDCGQPWDLVDPQGWENKVGTPVIHEHADNRIHIEGVLLDIEEASLHTFFEKVGGSLTPTGFILPTTSGIKVRSNGDLCNGQPGRWMVFVNGELEPAHEEHIIAGYELVPPGDQIKIVFDSRAPEALNRGLGGAP